MREEEKVLRQKLSDAEKAKKQLQSEVAVKERSIQQLRTVSDSFPLSPFTTPKLREKPGGDLVLHLILHLLLPLRDRRPTASLPRRRGSTRRPVKVGSVRQLCAPPGVRPTVCSLAPPSELEAKARVMDDMRLALTEQEETQSQMEEALEERLRLIQELSGGEAPRRFEGA